MERVLSVLTAFDVIAYLLSGTVLLGGLYWAVEGVPEKSPSAAAVLAFAAAAYVAGVLVSATGSLRDKASAWIRSQAIVMSSAARSEPVHQDDASTIPADAHIWTRWFAQAADEKYFPPSVRRRLDAALGPFAALETDAARAEIARSLLRQRGADAWFERMLLGMWLTSYLGTAALLLVACFLITAATEGDPARLLPAAGIAAGLAALLSLRRRQYERYAIRAVVYDLIALSDPPAWVRRHQATSAA